MNNDLFNLLVMLGVSSTMLTVLLFFIFIFRLAILRMKKKKFPRKNFLIMLTIAFFAILFWGNWLFNPRFLPQGFLTETINSPNGKLEARVYNFSGFIDYKNSRVDIFSKETDNQEMIYYNYLETPLSVTWIKNDTINIEDVNLKIGKDKYDFREIVR